MSVHRRQAHIDAPIESAWELVAGMDPKTPTYKVLDTLTGKRFYRRWTEQTLEALAAAAGRDRSAA